MPAGSERAGLGLAIADDAGDDQIGIVESGSVGVAQSVAQLAPFVNAARRLGGHVAGNSAGKTELLEQLLHPFGVLANIRIELAMCPFEIGMRHERRAAVPGTDDIDHVQVIFFDDPIEMHAEHVEAGRRAPMAEQPRLDVLPLERFFEQRVIEQVDLSDRQIVQSPPVGIHLAEVRRAESGPAAAFVELLLRLLNGGLVAICVSFLSS